MFNTENKSKYNYLRQIKCNCISIKNVKCFAIDSQLIGVSNETVATGQFMSIAGLEWAAAAAVVTKPGNMIHEEREKEKNIAVLQYFLRLRH